MFFYTISFIRNNHSDFMGFDIQLDFPSPSQTNKKKKWKAKNKTILPPILLY